MHGVEVSELLHDFIIYGRGKLVLGHEIGLDFKVDCRIGIVLSLEDGRAHV